MYLVYKVTHLLSHKCYIGQTIRTLDKRKVAHIYEIKKFKDYFHNALRKYGKDAFKWEVVYEGKCKLMLNIMETFMIMVHHSHYTEGGYNMTWGGDGRTRGFTHTDETKRKISNASRNRICTDEIRNNIRRAKLNQTDETKRKISEKAKSRYKNKENHPRYGKHLSAETKALIGQKHKNKKLSLKQKEALIKINTGSKRTEETKKKMSISAKKAWKIKKEKEISVG